MRKELLVRYQVGDYLSNIDFDKTLYGSMEDGARYRTLNAFLLGHTMRFLDNEVLEEGKY